MFELRKGAAQRIRAKFPVDESISKAYGISISQVKAVLDGKQPPDLEFLAKTISVLGGQFSDYFQASKVKTEDVAA